MRRSAFESFIPLFRRVLPWLAMLGAAAWLAGCASLPPLMAQPLASHALDPAQATSLGALARIGAPPDARSGFRLMPEGSSALAARIALARRAERTIDAQYYVLEDDPVGLLLLRTLHEAAQRGVRVRLLLDDLYTGRKDALLAALARQPNFEVRVFNPLPARGASLSWRLLSSLHEFDRINHRMHNKLFVADNAFAVAGGRNMADEYFMHSSVANFIDMDVLAAGPVVPELSASFDEYWNSTQVRELASLLPAMRDAAAGDAALLAQAWSRALPAPLPERASDVLAQAPVGEAIVNGPLRLTWAEARVLADIPEKIAKEDPEARYADSVTQRTVAVLNGARADLLLVSPYFIPGEEGLRLLQANAARGVRTMVLTNSLDATDESLVYAGYARYRLRLLRAGVRVYELGAHLASRDGKLGDFRTSSGRLHAKVAMVDDRQLFVGSMNLDGRSARLNTELGLLIDSPTLAAQFRQLAPIRALDAYELRLGQADDGLEWVEHRADGSEQSHRDEPGASWWLRFKHWLLLPFVPENLL